jgi:hypothetical protein
MSGAREVVIEFFGESPQELRELAATNPDEVSLLEVKGFGAAEYTLQALVILTPVITGQIASVVRAHIEARNSVRIKVDGVELEGLSADEAVKMLDRLGVETKES